MPRRSEVPTGLQKMPQPARSVFGVQLAAGVWRHGALKIKGPSVDQGISCWCDILV